MPHALLLSLALAAAAPAATGSDNLWLVAPLYPGQELLVSRTEQAIHKLLPEGSHDRVGQAALVQLLQEQKGDPGCALGEHPCKDVVSDYLRSLGLTRVVLIKGGQEEPNYVYQVVALDLQSGETRQASGSGPQLEKALLGALVKVAPLASSLTVASEPAGADVFIDNERVGKTPFDGQILPGERNLKLASPGYKDLTKTIQVPARGEVKLTEKLELAPSKLTVQINPKDAHVFIDKEDKGQGDQTLDISPGLHQVTVKKEGFEDFEEAAQVTANQTKVVVADLHPTFEANILGRTNYLYVGFEQEYLRPIRGQYKVNAFAIYNVQNEKNPNITGVAPNADQAVLRGIRLDYGIQRGHFGLMAVGLSYLLGGGGNFQAYPAADPGVFNTGALHVDANFNAYDLHALQPQVQYVIWHFMIQAQAGLGLRVLQIATPNFEDVQGVSHSGTGYIEFDPYVQGQINLRAYLVDGLFVAATGQANYIITGNSPFLGFTGGLGYAF